VGNGERPDLERRIEGLEARLEAVESVQAIERLKAHYGELVDQRYDRKGVVEATKLAELADRIAALFTTDAVWDGGPALGLCRGREAIRERFLAPTLLFSWHFFVKPQIRVDGRRAHGTWDIFAPCTVPDGRAFWMTGVETDEYERVDGVWLHSAMRLRVVFHAPYERGWA
jgi:hypothetical protein